jgi:hypothetical protein
MLRIFIRKKWLLSLLVLTFVVGIALSVLPMVMQRLVVAWLEQNGADRATIGNIDLNIFTGRIGVFDVEVEKAGELPLRVWRLTADVDLWHLSRKRFFIKAVWLYDTDLAVIQQEDGTLEIGGISLASTPQVESDVEEDADGPGFLDRWGVGIDTFAIKNSTIRYQSSLFDERVDIKSFYALNAFSWQPEQPARINFNILVNQQPVTLLSDARVFREAPDTSSTLQITELDLSHYEPVAKQAGIEELQGILTLSLVFDAVYETDKKADITIDSNIHVSDFRLRQGDLLVEHKSLKYRTETRLNLPAIAGEELGTTEGQLVIQDHTVAAEGIRANYSELVWNGNAVITMDDSTDRSPNIKVKGDLDVADLQIDDEKNKLKLAIAKKISAKDISAVTPNDARVGELVLSDLKALLQADSGKDPGLPEIGLKQGVLKQAQFNNETQSATVAGIELTDLSAQTADKKLQLAQVRTLNVEQVALKLQESASVNTVIVSDVQALKAIAAADSPDLEPAVYVSQTQLDDIQFQFEPQTLSLQSINIDGLNVLAKRQTDGSLYAINLLPTQPTEEPVDKSIDKPMQSAEKNSTSPLLFKIGTIRIGNDSKIRIVDQSVNPNFTANVAPLSLTVEQIDNANPTARTKIDLSTGLNPGNRITANGWLTPFAVKRDADINVEVKALDLVMFSPYSVSAAGYKVRSGRVDTTIKGKIANDMVNANTKIVAQRLNLDATSDAARGQSAQALGIGMPIDAALALMKDKNGNITIEVPVSGNLEDPDFAIGPAFRSAMTQAVKKASITYAAYALQPYGSILFGAKMLNKAMALRLESVRFEAGEAELNDRATSYLEKIAALMKDRPGISITLCGNATESDRQQLRNRNVSKLEEALIALAELRGDNVKDHMINEHGIAADRFFDCQPEVTSNESAQPEVRLGL